MQGFGLFVVCRIPVIGNKLEFAEDRGFTQICSTRLGFEFCKAGALFQCNGHEPSATTLDWEFGASFATEVVHPVGNPTQVSSDAVVRVSRLERCIAQLGPSDTHSRIEVSAGGLYKGTSSVNSPTPCPADRRLPRVLHMALRVACQEILDGMEATSEVRTVPGWKLFMVLPRMLLFRPPRGGVVSRSHFGSSFLVQGSHCESTVCRLVVSLFASLSAGQVNGPQRMVSARCSDGMCSNRAWSSAANNQPTKPQVASAKPPKGQRHTGVAPQTRPRLSGGFFVEGGQVREGPRGVGRHGRSSPRGDAGRVEACQVDFTCTPELHVTFCSIFVHPF